MIALCGVCREIVRAAEVMTRILPGAETDEQRAQRELQDFDLLAGAMAEHLNQRHQQHAMEMTAMMFLAGKAYAMRWAESTEPRMALMRDAWRAGVVDFLIPGYASGASPEAGPSPEGGSASGS